MCEILSITARCAFRKLVSPASAEIVQQLPKWYAPRRCRKGCPRSRVLFGPNLLPIWATFCKHGQAWRASVIWGRSRRRLETSVNLSGSWPTLRSWPMFAEIGSKLANLGHMLANLGQCWLKLDRASSPGASFGQLWSSSRSPGEDRDSVFARECAPCVCGPSRRPACMTIGFDCIAAVVVLRVDQTWPLLVKQWLLLAKRGQHVVKFDQS